MIGDELLTFSPETAQTIYENLSKMHTLWDGWRSLTSGSVGLYKDLDIDMLSLSHLLRLSKIKLPHSLYKKCISLVL